MHIALVDASGDAQAALAPILVAQGHEVSSCTNASDALARLRSDAQINALIAGTELSPISGAELCRETRLLAGKQRPLYVLLMSNGDRIAKVEALDWGADDIIEDPPLPDELCAKLRVAERTITLQQELIKSATTDYLSQAFNRGAFFEELTDAHQNLDQDGSLSLILIDIDRFKAINDRYGHDVGDDAIRAVADAARTCGASVGRMGGDEFCVLLKGHTLNQALIVAAALQQRLAEVRLKTHDGLVSLTCSLGVGELHPGDTVDDLMKRADLALYRAKDEGRNCIATTSPDSWIS